MASRVVFVIMLGLAACGGESKVARPSQTTLTSGELPEAKPPTARTVDSTGFVDNSGRTSDETVARPETSGVRASEAGSTDRPTGTNTGTPGAGTTRERPMVPKITALAPGAGGVSPVAGYDDLPGKMARAACDHEKVCDRVGDGKPSPSDGACTADMRTRAIGDLDAMGCNLDGSAVAVCLAEIRKASCNLVIDRPASLGACARQSLCAR
jgi:hypothetical protein